MIRLMEGFTFDPVLDLNMGYYHIKLDSDAQKYVPLYSQCKWENTNTNANHGHQDYLDPDVFQNVM
jgi:hypothetical protein